MNKTIPPTDHIRHYKYDGEFYDFFAPDKFVLQEIRRRYQEFFHLTKFNQSDFILEIGSGGGYSLEIFNTIRPFYFPLDIPLNNLKRIKAQSYFSIYPTASDGYTLPYKDESFNYVIMAEVLEHLATPEIVLKEVNRVLRKKGILLISVPYKEKITYQICIHCNKPTPTHSHLHSFDESKLSQLIKKAELKPMKFSKNCNKIQSRLCLNILFKNLPFRIWKIIDNLFNFFIDKPTSLILVSQKP